MSAWTAVRLIFLATIVVVGMLSSSLDHAVTMRGFTAELRLNGGRMDTVLMEALADLTSKLHVSLTAFVLEFERDLDVQGCNELCVGELPDV